MTPEHVQPQATQKSAQRSRAKSVLAAVGLLFLTSTSHGDADYSGTYILIQETATVTSLPVLADVTATTRAVSVQNLTQEGARLRGSGELCDVHLTSTSKMITMTLPQAFIRALPPVITDAVLDRRGGKLRFTQRPETIVLGASLSQPKTEPLPTEQDDPRVVDSDGDGHPGVTVNVSGFVSGDIYLVQRGTSSLDGWAQGDGFAGAVRFTNEQKILDATSRFLKSGPNAKPDLKKSRFVLKRVPSSTTCAQAKRLASSL